MGKVLFKVQRHFINEHSGLGKNVFTNEGAFNLKVLKSLHSRICFADVFCDLAKAFYPCHS
jgi:hypothetical protein